METWKERVSLRFVNIFEWIGIDPITGAISITPIVIWKINKREKKREKMLWEKVYDVGFVVGAVGIYTAFILNVFGVFS